MGFITSYITIGQVSLVVHRGFGGRWGPYPRIIVKLRGRRWRYRYERSLA